MVLSARRKKTSLLPYRLLLWSITGLVIGLFYLNQHPIYLEHVEELQSGSEITRESSSDIIIVLDYDAIQSSGESFEARDWSASWINIIEQEVGPVTIATPQSLSHTILGQARVLIWTSSVAENVSSTLMASIKQFINEGKLLILNQPMGSLREEFAANGRAGHRRGQRVTFAEGLSEPFQQQLRDMPLSTSYIGSTSPRDGSTTLLAIDGAPVIYSAPYGDGTVVTIDFDLGEQLVALQQGKPDENFQVINRDNPDELWTHTADLVMDKRLENSPIPYADLLERFIVYGIIQRYMPIATLWPFPAGKDGAILLHHDDYLLNNSAGWMLEEEAQHQSSSTLYVTADSTYDEDAAAKVHHFGGETGLLWRPHPSPDAPYQSIGIGYFHPISRPIGFNDQYESLRNRLPGQLLRTARSKDSTWTTQWARAFEIMATTNIRIDTSYGIEKSSGFAFSTGLPFHVFNSSGLPLGIREIPVVVSLDAHRGPSLQSILEYSADGHHNAIATTLAPSAFATKPDAQLYARWMEVFELSKQHNHHVTSIMRFEDFQRARRTSSLRGRTMQNIELPVAPPVDDTETTPRGTVLRLTVQTATRNQSIMVPEKFGDKSFLGAYRGARRVGNELVATEVPNEEASIIGYQLRRIALDSGFTNVDIFYH